MPPTAASLPATTTVGRRIEEPDAPPATRPRDGGRRRQWRPTLAAQLPALLALLAALLMVEAVAVLGPLREAQLDSDSALSSEIEHRLQARVLQLEFERQGQEWNNILVRGSDAAALPVYVQRYRYRAASVAALAEQLQDRSDDPTTGYLVAAFRNEYQAMTEAYDDALVPFLASGGRDAQVPQTATAGRNREPADRLAAVVDRADATTAAAQAARQTALAHRQYTLLFLGVMILVVMLSVVGVVVLGILRPLRRLAEEADHTARETLPAAVAQIRATSVDAAPPSRTPLNVDAGDELGKLGRAMSAMQTVVLDLAVQQSRTGRESAQTLINLGRRNQNLVERLQACVGTLQTGQQDPAIAADLEQIDSTTSRIRRSAEIMLVLGGATTHPLARTRLVLVADIVRAAAVQIADGARVDLVHVDEAAVTGATVADLTHLMAELLENATDFSPPDVRVTVVGRFGSSGRYGLHVVDRGIGMTGQELADANARIAGVVSGTSSDTHRLGLHVVGRLAARLGAEVTLRASTGRGLTAEVDLPSTTVMDSERIATEPDEWTPSRGSRRIKITGPPSSGSDHHPPGRAAVADFPSPLRKSRSTVATVTPPSGQPTATTQDSGEAT